MSAEFLLDTNIPSELTRPSPEPRVAAWVGAQDQALLYFSVVSVGELRKGFSLLPQSKRRTQLEQWFAGFLLPLFGTRILPVTQGVGERWGVLSARRQLEGTPLNTADGLIAATAIEPNLTLVTRNERDFVGLGAEIVNPWNIAELKA